MAFTRYSTGSTLGASLANMCVGPDGNLWLVTLTQVLQFNVATHITTTFAVTGSKKLTGICTDGTYLYVTDYQGTTTIVYRVTTAGVSSAFYNAFAAASDIYFDGTNIWVQTGAHFLEISTAGVLLNTYTGIGNPGLGGGGLFQDSTYWFNACEIQASNGVSRSTLAAPGTWSSFSSGLNTGDPVYASVEAGGLVWVGNEQANKIWSMVPSTGVLTLHTLSGAGQMTTSCFDGTSLWFASFTGIWQTTPSAPTVGTFYTSPSIIASLILYDAATDTIWAAGPNGTAIFVYGNPLTPPPTANGNFFMVMGP